ncbi:MAG TPA: nuclease-related domain-containing protein [Chloroflexota bacterium]|nr:nuclease-related domain-containing protein [Chloroflexota bacterium]
MRIVRAPRPEGPPPRWARTPAARRGEMGERVVRAALERALDDRYTLVHGLHLPGGDGDIDAVLVGPRVVVIEVKTYADSTTLRVRGLRWEYRNSLGRWIEADTQPSTQAEANARRVSYALRSAGLPAYNVAPVVVLVGTASCALERPRVPVLRPHELAAFVREPQPAVPPSWPELALRALFVAASAGVEAADGKPPEPG